MAKPRAQSVQNHVRPDPETFVLLAINTQKRLNIAAGKPQFKGIHVVYDGFNDAFRTMFPNDDVRQVTLQMQIDGKIRIFPVKGGAILVLPEDVTGKLKAEKPAKVNPLLSAMQMV